MTGTSCCSRFFSCFRSVASEEKVLFDSKDTSIQSDLKAKWGDFKKDAPKSISYALVDFAINWKNAEGHKENNICMSGVSWIAQVAISTLAIPLALIEGVARQALNFLVSFLATVSPWGTDKLNNFNKNLDFTLANHVVVAIVAAKSAFVGLFSPKHDLQSFQIIAESSYLCTKIAPSSNQDRLTASQELAK